MKWSRIAKTKAHFLCYLKKKKIFIYLIIDQRELPCLEDASCYRSAL